MIHFPGNRLSRYPIELLLISVALIGFLALCDWGRIVTRQDTRDSDFLAFLYFSRETFFRVDYRDRVPIGFTRWLVGLEALSNFLVGFLFLVQVVIFTTKPFISRRLREGLRDLLISADEI